MSTVDLTYMNNILYNSPLNIYEKVAIDVAELYIRLAFYFLD